MTQGVLFPDEHSQQLFADAVRDAVEKITLKELAFALDVAPGYLSDALRDIERKSLKLRWLPVILRMAPDLNRAEILNSLATPVNYRAERQKQLTPDEELRELRSIVGRLAPGVLALADQEIRR